ncbi:MAG: hypothetical protein JW982_15615 [Spirochaetes bacterium]|nr:hypothetical protein [Spirochaetota bacterium]
MKIAKSGIKNHTLYTEFFPSNLSESRKSKINVQKRMAYLSDSFMSRGSSSIFISLLILFLAGFFLLAGFRVVTEMANPEINGSFDKAVWTTWLELTDPGNMNQDNGSVWFIRIFTVLSGLFGIVFFSAVIAFITTQLDKKFTDLKKGRSHVLEKGHILILGWNQNIIEILKELIIANESERKGYVVILSDLPKEEMDDFLNEQISDRKNTRIITRTGEISSIHALERVAVSFAKSIIILPGCSSNSADEERLESDARTLKTVLAVHTSCDNPEDMPDIVVEVFEESNKSVILELARDKITIVKPEEMIAKITVQTSRTTGLASVYSGLFGFEGCEFYFTRQKWNGISFGDAVFHFSDGVLIGIRNSNGEIILNPEPETLLKDSQDLIILAEDDSTINYHSRALYSPADIPYSFSHKKAFPEKILIIGWNTKGLTLINEFMDYIKNKSEILIAVEKTTEIPAKQIKAIQKNNSGIKFTIKIINPYNLNDLKSIKPELFNSIIILNTVHDNQEIADAKNINILLLIRSLIRENIKSEKVQIISEVMNADNLKLINQTGVNDSIISTKMISKIMAQIAEEPDVLTIYNELFTEAGSEIYLKPLSYYTENSGITCTFADIIKLAQKRKEICIGIRDISLKQSVDDNFGIILNPGKDTVLDLKSDDCLIVLAEDEY